VRRSSGRGEQAEYNRLLDEFGGKTKTPAECLEYLVGLGFSINQAKNAVHVYRKGGPTESTFRLDRWERDRLLDDFDAPRKKPRQCVEYLRSLGCTYRQATTAVYNYRLQRGLIGH
jgi:hypothetical protein